MTTSPRLLQAWNGFVAQLAASAGLRMGLLAIVTLLAVYGLMAAADGVEGVRKDSAELRSELERLAPLARERAWPERADEARRQREALDGMLWVGNDAALVEADLQDWLRATAAKWGVSIRELELVRGEVTPRAASAAAPVRLMRVRLATDLKTVSMLGFLSELGQSERLVLVDRLVLRPAAQPALAELELRVLALAKPADKGAR